METEAHHLIGILDVHLIFNTLASALSNHDRGRCDTKPILSKSPT